MGGFEAQNHGLRGPQNMWDIPFRVAWGPRVAGLEGLEAQNGGPRGRQSTWAIPFKGAHGAQSGGLCGPQNMWDLPYGGFRGPELWATASYAQDLAATPVGRLSAWEMVLHVC